MLAPLFLIPPLLRLFANPLVLPLFLCLLFWKWTFCGPPARSPSDPPRLLRPTISRSDTFLLHVDQHETTLQAEHDVATLVSLSQLVSTLTLEMRRCAKGPRILNSMPPISANTPS